MDTRGAAPTGETMSSVIGRRRSSFDDCRATKGAKLKAPRPDTDRDHGIGAAKLQGRSRY